MTSSGRRSGFSARKAGRYRYVVIIFINTPTMILFRIISEMVENALEEESKTCNVNEAQSVFMSILQTPGLDVRDKKAAIIDFIAAGIQTVSEKCKDKEINERIERGVSTILCPRLGAEWNWRISWLPRAHLGPIFMTGLPER